MAGMTVDVRVVQIGYDEALPLEDQLQRGLELIAGQQNADLVVLPELWLHGAFASWSWRQASVSIDGDLVERLGQAARDTGSYLLAGSIVERGDDQYWNTSLLFDRSGRLVARYRKIHRFGFDEGEPTVVDAGAETVTVELVSRGGERLCTLGLAICYDLRFPELFRNLTYAGADVLVIPACWPLPRVTHWTALGVARAIENQAFVVQCNDTGTHSAMDMGGHSQIVDPTGRVLASATRGDVVLSADLDLEELHRYRRAFPALGDRRFAVPHLERQR